MTVGTAAGDWTKVSLMRSSYFRPLSAM